MTSNKTELVEHFYPEMEWNTIHELDRAINYELWNGVLPLNYWTEVEPLEHYKWVSYTQAETDLRNLLDDLPREMWVDNDSDCLSDSDPYDDEINWEDYGGDDIFIGGDWSKFIPTQEILHPETWKQVI